MSTMGRWCAAASVSAPSGSPPTECMLLYLPWIQSFCTAASSVGQCLLGWVSILPSRCLALWPSTSMRCTARAAAVALVSAGLRGQARSLPLLAAWALPDRGVLQMDSSTLCLRGFYLFLFRCGSAPRRLTLEQAWTDIVGFVSKTLPQRNVSSGLVSH